MDGSQLQQPEFGKKLRQYRLERGMSQRDVAGDSITPSYVSLLEAGIRHPTLNVVLQLSKTLGITPQQFIQDDALPLLTEPNSGIRVLSMILARSAVNQGDLSEAGVQLRTLYLQAQAEGDPYRTLDAGFNLHDLLFATGNVADRYELAGELLELAEQFKSPETLVKVLVDYASSARDAGKLDHAEQLAERARELIIGTAVAETSEHVRLLGVYLSILCETSQLDAAPAVLKEMVEKATQLGSPGVQARAHWSAAVAHTRLGNTAEAAEELGLAQDTMSRQNLTMSEWLRFCRSAASILVDANTNLDDAGRYLSSATAALETARLPGGRGRVDAVSARLELLRGHAAEAERLCRQIVEAGEDLPPLEQARVQVTWGHACRELGQPKDAEKHLRSAALAYEQAGALRRALELWREVHDGLAEHD